MKIATQLTLLLSMTVGLNFPAGAAPAEPDLMIHVAGPRRAHPGDDIGPQIRQHVTNRGEAPAPGTAGRINPADGYMIDLVLSRDQRMPGGFASVSDDFREDALLPGGRTSRTDDLFRGNVREYRVGARIPANTPPGRYFICARVDAGDRVAESNERNNTDCFAIEIAPPPPPAVGIGHRDGRNIPPPPVVGIGRQGRRVPPPPAIGIGNGNRGPGVPHYHTGERPDLVVAELSINPATPTEGQPVFVRIGVYNQGNQDSGPFMVQWWPGENYREPANTWHVDGVRARGGRILTFRYDGYPSWYGQIRTKVVLDPSGAVVEGEERNNTGTRTIRVNRR